MYHPNDCCEDYCPLINVDDTYETFSNHRLTELELEEYKFLEEFCKDDVNIN